MCWCRGVNKLFKTLARLASRPVFSLAKSENDWPKLWKGYMRGEKALAWMAIGFVFLLANLEFYLHLASWRVVIRTPVMNGLTLRSGSCTKSALALVWVSDWSALGVRMAVTHTHTYKTIRNIIPIHTRAHTHTLSPSHFFCDTHTHTQNDKKYNPNSHTDTHTHTHTHSHTFFVTHTHTKR
jgi:hypothetical protein